MNLIKPFSITTAGIVAGLLINKAITYQSRKQRYLSANEELNRLHQIRALEIKKSGKVSEETLSLIKAAMDILKED